MAVEKQDTRHLFVAVGVLVFLLFTAAKTSTDTVDGLKESAIGNLLETAARSAAAGQTSAAARDFRLALSLNPGSFEARLGLARALLSEGNWQEAQGHLSQLRTMDPISSDVNLLSARAELAAGREQAASDYYYRAVYGYWPPGAMKERLKARMEMVMLLARRGDRDALVPELLRLQRESPDDVVLKTELARLMLQAGMSQEAAEQYRSLLHSAPDDAQLRAGLAEAELRLGNHATALQIFRALSRQEPQNERYAERASLCERILELDPLARRVSLSLRLRRSQLLVDSLLGLTESCGAAAVVAPLIDDARRQAQEPYRAATADESLERNIQTAERLWGLLPATCKQKSEEAAALRYVFARLEKGGR